MKKVIRLTESDLARIVRRVIEEQTPTPTRPANPATPSGVSLRYKDGQSYPTKLTLITNQQKLDSFLDWGATQRNVAVQKLKDNGYIVSDSLLNAANGKDTKIDPQSRKEVKMSEDEFNRLYIFANQLLNMVNVGLTTVARYFPNPGSVDYMPTVIAQIDKFVSQSADWQKYYGNQKPSSQLDIPKFTTAFKNIVNQQLDKVSRG